MGERMGEKMCEKMCEMCEKMGEQMGEKRCEGKRETAIYRVRSPGQTAENDVKHPEVRRKKMSLHGRRADGDNCLGMSSGWHRFVKVQWEQIWDPWLGKGAFSGPSLKVDDVW